MNILAIDPGSERSAWVVYDTETKALVTFGICSNSRLVLGLKSEGGTHLAIEMIACYGMSVGKTVFNTCVWIGRFIQAWIDQSGLASMGHTQVYRMQVKMHLCHHASAKDSNIRQAIIDRYPETGGGKTPQIGTKAHPGPLYGVSKDVWAALGVAITYAETMLESDNA